MFTILRGLFLRALIRSLGFICVVAVAAGAAENPYRARKVMVVSADERATRVGVEILRNGGNAVDAAVAVGFALAAVFPEAGNIGGGGFMLVRMSDGRSAVIDFREAAPAAASRTMYIDSAGNSNGESFFGHRAAGVPGTVAGLLKGLSLFGTQARDAVLNPAITMAKRGVQVNERLARLLAEYGEELLAYPATRSVVAPRGELLSEGEIMTLPDLAETLERIREKGEEGFYKGRTAELIVAEMQRGRGLMTAADLAQYTVVIREPVRGSYRGYEILSAPPPSSGGVCLLEALNILEGYDMQSYGYHSVQSVHYIVEAMKRMHADRAQYLGDPDFADVPVEEMISKEYAAKRRAEIDSLRATLATHVRHGEFDVREGVHTTHYSVVDEQGNAVAVTYTLNDVFGNKVVVDGAGFFLNNEMDDFSIKPGVPNVYGLIGAEANAIEPGKRPLSSMTPTILLKDDKPFMVMGARGGSRIISAVLQAIVGVIDYGMNIQEAVSMPRFHHQWQPDTLRYERFAFPPETIEALTAAGYHCRQYPTPAAAALECILIDPKSGFLYGGADPREGGVAGGY